MVRPKMTKALKIDTPCARANGVQAQFVLVDMVQHRPVSEASIIQFPTPDAEDGELLGFSDAQGRVDLASISPYLRILAQGYAPKDLILLPGQDLGHIEMQPLSEAAYSGYIPNKKRTIWAPEGQRGTFFEFTSDGLMRAGPNLKSLMKANYRCYAMKHRSQWTGLNAPVADHTDWLHLDTADMAFPVTFKSSVARTEVNQFSFPEPGLMLARSAAQSGLEFRHTILA